MRNLFPSHGWRMRLAWWVYLCIRREWWTAAVVLTAVLDWSLGARVRVRLVNDGRDVALEIQPGKGVPE